MVYRLFWSGVFIAMCEVFTNLFVLINYIVTLMS